MQVFSPQLTSGSGNWAHQLTQSTVLEQTQTGAYNVKGGAFDWAVTPSKQPDNPIGNNATQFPDLGYNITASANGRYSAATNVKVPMYQMTVKDVDFDLPLAVTVDFDFDKNYGAKGDFVIPFTTYDKATGAAADVTGLEVAVDGKLITPVSLGSGKYEAKFNLYALGLVDLDEVDFTIAFDTAAFLGALALTENAFTLSVTDETDFYGDVVYTLSVGGATNMLTAELEFEIDSVFLEFTKLEPLVGFELFDVITWTDLPGGIKKANLKLVYPAAGASTGFTSHADVAIAKFTYTPKNLGDTTMELTSSIATGYDALTELTAFIDSDIDGGAATTLIRSRFDLNRDNKIDALDISVALLYFGHHSLQADWATLVKVYDVKGGGITPAMCDVNDDNTVNMLDLMAIYMKYHPI
jgi:hypothetical protein